MLLRRTIINKAILLVLFMSAVLTVSAQSSSSLSLGNIRGNGNKWSYGTVVCTSTNNVTSITLSMINNTIDLNTSSIMPSSTYNSLGVNPRTITYLFNTPITADQVEEFIQGITFAKTNEVAGASHVVRISVDANPTLLPPNATITVWDKHPDGTPHYYVWVQTNRYTGYMQAYNAAKSYYFQGMRGYLPTITSAEEDALLTNISALGGWSGGARTTDAIADVMTIASNPSVSGLDYKWLCGPEAELAYCRTSSNAAEFGAIALNSAYIKWWATPGFSTEYREPNGAGGIENCMQVNFTSNIWNDLPPADGTESPAILGYFIEFGGSSEGYSVGGANYPANLAYRTPSVTTNNDQWYFYSPGNTSTMTTTIKAKSLRANHLVLE